MGYCVIRNNNKYIYNLVEIICDLDSDVVSIPTTFSPGSKVFCCREFFILYVKCIKRVEETSKDRGGRS